MSFQTDTTTKKGVCGAPLHTPPLQLILLWRVYKFQWIYLWSQFQNRQTLWYYEKVHPIFWWPGWHFTPTQVLIFVTICSWVLTWGQPEPDLKFKMIKLSDEVPHLPEESKDKQPIQLLFYKFIVHRKNGKNGIFLLKIFQGYHQKSYLCSPHSLQILIS